MIVVVSISAVLGTVSPHAALGEPHTERAPHADHNAQVSDNQTISRLITAAARVHLRPLGLRQKGRSRLWFDDRGWSVIVVEFQPGSGPGTYLNVGAMWLWAERDYWAFDEGGRVRWRDDGSFAAQPPPMEEQGWSGHINFLNPDQFARDVVSVALAAAGRVIELRAHFTGPGAVAEHLSSSSARPELWDTFHLGVAAALRGDAATADERLAAVMTAEMSANWMHALAAQAADLRSLLGEPALLRGHVAETTRRTRSLLKLPEDAFDPGSLAGLR